MISENSITELQYSGVLSDQDQADDGFASMLKKYNGNPSKSWLNMIFRSYEDYGINTSNMRQLVSQYYSNQTN